MRALIGGALVVLVVFTAKAAMAWPGWIARARMNATSALMDLEAARAMIAAAPAAKDTLTVRAAQLASLSGTLLPALTPGEAVAQLASIVADAATASGLDIVSITTYADSGSAGSALVRPRVQGEARGDVAGLASFLLATEGGDPPVAVRQLTIMQQDLGAGSDRPETLRIEFLIEVAGLREAATGDFTASGARRHVGERTRQ